MYRYLGLRSLSRRPIAVKHGRHVLCNNVAYCCASVTAYCTKCIALCVLPGQCRMPCVCTVASVARCTAPGYYVTRVAVQYAMRCVCARSRCRGIRPFLLGRSLFPHFVRGLVFGLLVMMLKRALMRICWTVRQIFSVTVFMSFNSTVFCNLRCFFRAHDAWHCYAQHTSTSVDEQRRNCVGSLSEGPKQRFGCLLVDPPINAVKNVSMHTQRLPDRLFRGG